MKLQDVLSKTYHISGKKKFIIMGISDKPIPGNINIYEYIKFITTYWKADIFLQLPPERKLQWLDDVLTPLTKYYDHGYIQSWLQYLYSKDFQLADEYPTLRIVFPKDYDHGLNLLYKKVKSCVPDYKKSRHDNECPFDPNIEVVVFNRITALNPKKYYRNDREVYVFLKYLHEILKIKNKYASWTKWDDIRDITKLLNFYYFLKNKINNICKSDLFFKLKGPIGCDPEMYTYKLAIEDTLDIKWNQEMEKLQKNIDAKKYYNALNNYIELSILLSRAVMMTNLFCTNVEYSIICVDEKTAIFIRNELNELDKIELKNMKKKEQEQNAIFRDELDKLEKKFKRK